MGALVKGRDRGLGSRDRGRRRPLAGACGAILWRRPHAKAQRRKGRQGKKRKREGVVICWISVRKTSYAFVQNSPNSQLPVPFFNIFPPTQVKLLNKIYPAQVKLFNKIPPVQGKLFNI